MASRLVPLLLFPIVALRDSPIETEQVLPESPLETFNRPCAEFDDARTVASLHRFQETDSLSAECDALGGSSGFVVGGPHRWITVGHVSAGKKECRLYTAFEDPENATEKDWEEYADSGCLAVHKATAGGHGFQKCMRSHIETFFDREWPHLAALLHLPLSGEKNKTSAENTDGIWKAQWSVEDIRKNLLKGLDLQLHSLKLQKRTVEFVQDALGNKVENLEEQMRKWVEGIQKRVVRFKITEDIMSKKWEEAKEELVREYSRNDDENEKMVGVANAFSKVLKVRVGWAFPKCLGNNWDAFHGLRCEPATLPNVGFSGQVQKDIEVVPDAIGRNPCKCPNLSACGATEILPYHPAIIRWGVGRSSLYFGNRYIYLGSGFLNHQMMARLSAEEVCRNSAYSGMCWLFSFCTKWEAAKGQFAMLKTRNGSSFSIARIKLKMWWMDGWIAAKLNPVDMVKKGVQYFLPANLKEEWWTQEL
uniref:Peptidase S1 domain-containing protein n=1 Tax=Chromera velia CCMP2878 TaxID=1169474 RepID=A0A0G4FJJ3_9ALVE|eukprot:Cvel_17188.t1-p1 / transcript=Cvel_17188.t1 / gene=Cvel_17188 / organism=Chromera_velia_CCMP2878 / gene_product=hypothetical protein / transcript_product=hypothetical protein / location=Cvel_scaffold1358:5781-8240(+) / protein_length=476 / sequence_SO=supercontig / SO=protein_coding / is_pseudo=false